MRPGPPWSSARGERVPETPTLQGPSTEMLRENLLIREWPPMNSIKSVLKNSTELLFKPWVTMP